MAKDNKFYFSHDYNARNDRKIALLVRDYKAAGYGIYWCTAEMMHEEGGCLDFDDITFAAIGKDLNEAPEAIEAVLRKCIEVYKLFIFDENQITANRVKKNLTEHESRKLAKVEAGRKGGLKSGESRRYEKNGKKVTKQIEAVLQAERSTLEANEPKESKVKESKVKEILYSDCQIFQTKISGLGTFEITVLNNCESWQLTNLGNFITKSEKEFQAIAMSKPPMKNVETFQAVLQDFVNTIQSRGEYKETPNLKSHFANWLNSKNGTLETYVAQISGNKPKMVY